MSFIAAVAVTVLFALVTLRLHCITAFCNKTVIQYRAFVYLGDVNRQNQKHEKESVKEKLDHTPFNIGLILSSRCWIS